MASPQAEAMWQMFRDAPVKQTDLDLPQRRAAGVQAEMATSTPDGVHYADAPEVGGFWAVPPAARDGAALLYLFGGGFMLGNPESRRKTAGHLALATGTRVLVADYRLAPENPFPAGLDDAVAAYRWLVTQAAGAAPIAPERVVLVGDSAGGGLCIATMLVLRDAGEPLPGGCVTISPWVDLTLSGGSMQRCAASDVELTEPGLRELAEWYLGDGDPRAPLASPVFADLSGLAPLLCVVGSDEILLDDSVRLCLAVIEAGGTATLHAVAGMQHAFSIWAGVFPEADASIELIGGWIRATA
ncbi:MAG: bah [Actinomycetia bacterium]|nr:bah [Actinomycetes bacterium]